MMVSIGRDWVSGGAGGLVPVRWERAQDGATRSWRPRSVFSGGVRC